jgi:hypothetical protein
MNPVETLQTFDTIIQHLDHMLRLDEEQLRHALQTFSTEYPNESNDLLCIMRERKSLEEERLRILQMKVDYIGEWLKKIRESEWHDPKEIDTILHMLHIDPKDVNPKYPNQIQDAS